MTGFARWLEAQAPPRAWFISPQGEVYPGQSHGEIAEDHLGTNERALNQLNWAQIGILRDMTVFHQNQLTQKALDAGQRILAATEVPKVQVLTSQGYTEITRSQFVAGDIMSLTKAIRGLGRTRVA